MTKRIFSSLALMGIVGLIPGMGANESKPATESLIIGGGCFWCIEALYETIDGVIEAESGYAGGRGAFPTYEEVCSGTTGHAEVVKITFDPEKVTLEELLEFFWEAHDPTSLNRQGADVGTQYRSIILYQSEHQKSVAEASMKKASSVLANPIVTEISPLKKFYKAEKYHQDYFKNNPNAPYCRYVIVPKLKKLES